MRDHLITIDEVRQGFMNSEGPAMRDALWGDPQTVHVHRVVGQVSRRLREGLNRPLIAEVMEWEFATHDWRWTGYTREGKERQMFARLPKYPIVQILEVDEETDHNVTVAGYRWVPGTVVVDRSVGQGLPRHVRYVAGFRREDQGLDDLDIEGLTVLPPLLPEDIALACLRAVVAELREAAAGLIGVASVSATIEDNTVSHTRLQANFWRRELGHILHHRIEAL